MSDVTTTSGGQAIIPPFELYYASTNEYLACRVQLANISNETVHVVLNYINGSGEVAQTTEVNIAAKTVVFIRFTTESTPGSVILPFYGTIDWTGPYMVQKPLVAHGYVRHFLATSSGLAQSAYSLPINNGMPF
jgi:hypothetical protein